MCVFYSFPFNPFSFNLNTSKYLARQFHPTIYSVMFILDCALTIIIYLTLYDVHYYIIVCYCFQDTETSHRRPL